LQLTTGQSDVQGDMTIDISSGRPKSNAKLNSKVLRLADFGLRAAGRESEPPAGAQLLLSSATLNPEALRRGDGRAEFKANRVEVGRQLLHDASVTLKIEHGVATATPLAAEILGGRLSGRVTMDARPDVPLTDAELSIDDLQLAQLPHKSADAPLDGALRVRLKISGQGTSVHQIAATARGSASASLPQGTMRASLAELIGTDLRGLGLALEKSRQETPVRCGAANFTAQQGVFTLQRLVLDTAPVLISGEGSVHMDTEALDLRIRGEPKSLRLLRLRAPLSIRGVLAHPQIGLEHGESKLLLVDRGRAKDEDCAALVQ
jgi:AsmA family protein